MALPNSGLDIRNRTWLKIPIPMSFLGKQPSRKIQCVFVESFEPDGRAKLWCHLQGSYCKKLQIRNLRSLQSQFCILLPHAYCSFSLVTKKQCCYSKFYNIMHKPAIYCRFYLDSYNQSSYSKITQRFFRKRSNRLVDGARRRTAGPKSRSEVRVRAAEGEADSPRGEQDHFYRAVLLRIRGRVCR